MKNSQMDRLHSHDFYKVVPQFVSVQLVNIGTISRVFMGVISIINWELYLDNNPH